MASSQEPYRIRLPMQGFRCIKCGYDLSGTSIGEYCPECGLPTGTSVVGEPSEERKLATITLAFGLLSLTLAPALVGLWTTRWAFDYHRRTREEIEQIGWTHGWMSVAHVGVALSVAAWVIGVTAAGLIGVWLYQEINRLMA